VLLSALRALVALAKIHPQLPLTAAARVGHRAHAWDEPLQWSDVAADPVGSVCRQYDGDPVELPDGAYEADCRYPVERFALDEQANKDLAALCRALEVEIDQVAIHFGREAVEEGTRLGAAHQSHEVLPLGQEHGGGEELQEDDGDDDVDRPLGEGHGADDDEDGEGERDHHRLDRRAPLLGLVDVLQAEPECELVQREPGADPERDGEDLGPRRVRVGREPQEAAQQQQDDPPHQVVDVQVAGLHAARPPRDLGAAHQARAGANEEERVQEAGEQPECDGPR